MRRGLVHSLFEPGLLSAQLLEDLDPVGKADDGAAIALAKGTQEVDGCLMYDIHLVGHAGARVDHQDQVDRNLGGLEEADLLFHPVLEDGEVLSGQVGHELAPGTVEHAHVQRDEARPTPEDGLLVLFGSLRLFGDLACANRCREDESESNCRDQARHDILLFSPFQASDVPNSQARDCA